ncbi:BOP1NT-domain-containing protein [Clavulina sp. PMI_390]|nr:BOP1NT-domain-containing protein [Clavulina sp. PMI_390]
MAPPKPNLSKANTTLKRKRDSAVKESLLSTAPKNAINVSQLDVDEDSDVEEAASGSGSGDDSDAESFPEVDAEDDDEDSDADSGQDDDEDQDSDDSYLVEDSDFVDSIDSGDENENEVEDDEIYTGPKARTVISKITGRPKRVYPEIEPDYDSDSSTEEDPNRVGNIPMHWYDDLPHIGYDIDGKKVLRPARGDELDKFLSTVDDPTSWTAGFDKLTQSEQQLSPEELDIIRRLQAAENPDANYDPYEPTVEWFTGKGKEEIMPISAKPEPKRRWQPSKWEKQKVMKIVRAIRAGHILPRKPTTTKPDHYDLWSTPASNHPPPLPAPKVSLPGHAESYNPPEEYLPTPDEKSAWENTDPEDRDRNFLSQKYGALRLVPGYDNFIQERFSRLLDLYLAPRIQRKRLNIDPDSLLPNLPSPAELKPFPTFELLRYEHASQRVRAIAISPDGMWVASGDEMGIVRVWETMVGREAGRYKFDSRVGAIAWCPRDDVDFFAVGVDEAIHLLIPPYQSPERLANTMATLKPTNPPQPVPTTATTLSWAVPALSNTVSPNVLHPHLTIQLQPSSGLVKHLTFHRRGDYFASVGDNGAVWIHQMSKRNSQAPFRKVKGAVQRVLFHPSKPHFFVATQRYIRLYDLAGQKLIKTLKSGMKWISSVDVHHSGDHLVVGGYDKKLAWFDLDLSDKPYKVLKYHTKAIRSVTFHPSYPLFATSSDDGTIQIFHGRVYNDFTTDPLIVPLKVLKGHSVSDGLGVLEIRWSKEKPWLVSAGADGKVAVWCN